MKKVSVLLAVVMLLVVMTVPTSAWDGVDFKVVDGDTLKPWGTVDGQTYRIIILYNNVPQYNQEFTTPTDGPLEFSCAWGQDPCNGRAGANAFPATPTVNDNVKVIIAFTGTNGNPTPVQETFDYYGSFGLNYSIDAKLAENGPTAVSLQNVAADSNTTTAAGIGLVVMILAGVTFVMVRRREVA